MEAASSSSDDDSSQDSSSSSSSSSVSGINPKEHVIRGERKATSLPRQEGNSDSESGSDTDSGSDDDSESDNDDKDDEILENEKALSMPLGERLRQQQQRERGVDMTEKRARQAEARKIASERVGRAKKHDDDDDDEEEEEEKEIKKPSKVKKEKKDMPAATGAATCTTSRKGKSKHAPTEVSSKRRDFYERKLRGVEPTVGAGTGVDIGAHAYKPRDPRISSLSGHLDEEHFERNYSFLNEMRNAEIELLKKRIVAHKATGKKGQRLRQKFEKKQEEGIGRHFAGTTLEDNVLELKRLQQEKAALERTQVDRNAKRAVKQHVKETSGSGKITYYLKRHEKKRLHLEAKYEEIRKRGGDQAVDKVLAKRRKKNKSKDAGLLGGGGKLAAGSGSAGRY